jgi:hypothetical protein
VSDETERVQNLLHEVAETHHQVFRISDGEDADWASWYANWLTRLSELPELLGRAPVRSELTYHLVALDKEYTTSGESGRPWERFYAERLVSVFS